MSNQQFLDAPRAFASQHALLPHADPAVNQQHMRDIALNDGSFFTQVQGENKVAWCNLRPPSDFPNGIGAEGMGDYRQDTGLLVMHVTYQQSGDAFPVYYLPWAGDAMFRIKLKPSPKHPTKTGFFLNPWKTTVEPNVFITAGLQGCSIIVSGDPQQPVVYHLNAESTKGPLGEEVGTNNDHDFQAAANAKRQAMLGRYAMARAQHAKEGPKPRPPQTFTSQAAHLTDYMPDMLPSRRTALELMHLGPLGGGVGQFGTVFGIRKADGNWRFYRQTRTRVVNFGPYNERTRKHDDTATWVNPVCTKFWP